MANKQFADDFEISKPELRNPSDIALPNTPTTELEIPAKPGALKLPLPGLGAPANSDILSNLNNFLDTSEAASLNPTVQTKSQIYGAGMDHHQFERYYALPSVYNKLGFSPFRDNETLYNKESNFFNEFGRASSQWLGLAGLGAIDSMSFGSLTDTKSAKKMNDAMAIGSSSKGGIGGFITNLHLNSAYTMGIMGEAFLEELALGAITTATAGADVEITGPMAIAKGIDAGHTILEGAKASENVIRTLDAMKDVSKARKFFTSVGKVVNPLENSVEFLRGIDNVKSLKNLGTATRGFADFYRDVRNIRNTWSEASLEGGTVRNTLEADLLKEYLDTHDGKAPSELEALRMKETAHKAGLTTAWQNVGTIYFSNKLVFDSFKPFGKLFKKGAVEEVMEAGVHGKIIRNRNLMKSPFEHVEKTWKNTLNTLKNPSVYASTALTYFKANLAEGLQESAQEVISGAAVDFYKNEWRGTPLKGGYYAAITDNLQKQVSAGGLDVFMSGFLMGGMVGPVMNAPSFISQKYNQYTKPEQYKKRQEAKEDYINKTVNQLNELWDNNKAALVPDLDNLEAQDTYAKGMKKAAATGDAKTYHDLKDAGYYEHIYTALKMGRFDTFIEQLKDQKNLTADDIEKSFGMSQEEYFGAMDKATERAERIKQRYETIQEKLVNPFKPDTFEEGTIAHDIESNHYIGWENAQKKAIFLQYSFDRNLERMGSTMNEAQQDAELSKVSQSEFNTLFQTDTMDAELSILQDEIKSLTGSKGESLKLLKSKVIKEKLLRDFNEKMKVVSKSPIVEGSPETLDLAHKDTKKAVKVAQTAYNHYLKHLAEVNKTYAFDDALTKSFSKLVDYHMLDKETRALNEHVNVMLNPKAFTRDAARNSVLAKARRANRQKEFRDSLEVYIKAKETNELMQALYDKGMFFDPDELVKLTTDGDLPTKFYYTPKTNTEEIKEVIETSDDFDIALAIVRNFITNVRNIPIKQAKPSKYDSRARRKFDTDKRTYADLATQYGFDPTAATSTVSLKQVLESIVASDNATPEEKMLANDLLTKVKTGDIVTFKNDMAQPGTFSMAEQTMIDARYSSAEYRADGLPIEHVILHEEIHRRTVLALDEDEAFKAKIDKLYDLTMKHFETHQEAKERLPYGLSNIHEFVAEAMSNSKFQELLAEIPFDAGKATVWTKFIDSVIDMLATVLGTKVSNTVLNEALHIITVKIDEQNGPSNETITPSTPVAASITGDNVKLTKKDSLIDPELIDTLIDLYRKRNQSRIDSGDDPLDPDLADKSPTQIINSSQFKNYYKHSSETQTALDAYNLSKGRIVEPAIVVVTTNTGSAIMSTAMRNELIRLHYDPSKVNLVQAQAIIDRNLTKEDADAIDVLAKDLEKEILGQAQKTLRNEIEALINNAKTIEELDINTEHIAQLLDDTIEGTGRNGWDSSGYTATDLDALIKARKEALILEFEVSDLYPGMVIIMKNNEKIKITEITDTMVYGHKDNDITKERKYKKATVKEKIKYIFKANMQDDDIEIPGEQISDAAEEISSETQKISETALSNQDITAEAIKNARDGGDTDWLNPDNLNNCG